MSNKNKSIKGLQPKLRFPEFRNAGDWEPRALGKIVALVTEKTEDRKFTLLSITSGVGLVSQMKKFGREIAGAAYKNYFVIRKNDFAYNKSATKEYPEGYIAMYSGEDEGAVPNSIFTCFRVQDSEVNAKYLDYLFSSNLHGKWLRNFLAIGARAHGSLNVDNNDLLSLPAPMPRGQHSSKEQQKIADCLSSLDELISAEDQKLEALQRHKKGLMQELFPAEGETIPNRRFPEYQNAPEWKEIELQKIAKPVLERAVGLERQVVLTLSAEHGLISQSDYFGKKIAGDNTERYIKIIENDFVYNDRTTKAFAYGTIKRLSKHQAGIVSPIYKCFRFEKEEKPIFWEWYFESGSHETRLRSLINEGARTGRFNISIDKFLSTKALRPEPDEQERIADFLSSIDDLITSQSEKLDALRNHKKGLMQQLFPTLASESEG